MKKPEPCSPSLPSPCLFAVAKAVVAKAPAMPKKVALSAAVTSLATQALPALAVVS